MGEEEGDKTLPSPPLQGLTLAVSSSCRSSSRLEGFSEEVTQVRWPRNWIGNGGVGGRRTERSHSEDPDLLTEAMYRLKYISLN